MVGYDDVELAQDLRPRLTSVHVPYEELGRAAAKIALDSQHQQPGLDRRPPALQDPRGGPRLGRRLG